MITITYPVFRQAIYHLARMKAYLMRQNVQSTMISIEPESWFDKLG